MRCAKAEGYFLQDLQRWCVCLSPIAEISQIQAIFKAAFKLKPGHLQALDAALLASSLKRAPHDKTTVASLFLAVGTSLQGSHTPCPELSIVLQTLRDFIKRYETLNQQLTQHYTDTFALQSEQLAQMPADAYPSLRLAVADILSCQYSSFEADFKRAIFHNAERSVHIPSLPETQQEALLLQLGQLKPSVQGLHQGQGAAGLRFALDCYRLQGQALFCIGISDTEPVEYNRALNFTQVKTRQAVYACALKDDDGAFFMIKNGRLARLDELAHLDLQASLKSSSQAPSEQLTALGFTPLFSYAAQGQLDDHGRAQTVVKITSHYPQLLEYVGPEPGLVPALQTSLSAARTQTQKKMQHLLNHLNAWLAHELQLKPSQQLQDLLNSALETLKPIRQQHLAHAYEQLQILSTLTEKFSHMASQFAQSETLLKIKLQLKQLLPHVAAVSIDNPNKKISARLRKNKPDTEHFLKAPHFFEESTHTRFMQKCFYPDWAPEPSPVMQAFRRLTR